jgi:two-component system chemotaxis response regulator CheB
VSIANLEGIPADHLPAQPAGLGCPACGGSLFELAHTPLPRYRCRIGHAWTSRTLFDEQAGAVEDALWMALRALEDKAALSRRLARTRTSAGVHGSARRYTAEADAAERASAVMRELIATVGVGAADPAAPEDEPPPVTRPR